MLMHYHRVITLKNGRPCLLRNAAQEDGAAVLDNFLRTHAETDYLLTYPDECTMDAAQEGRYLREKAESGDEIEIVAVVDGVIAGTAGIDAVGRRCKIRHRAEFGVSVLRDFWGLGIGQALTQSCIECAKNAGYRQLELSVVAENNAALALYRKLGFLECGRNPRGFRSRITGDQELVSMRLELDEK